MTSVAGYMCKAITLTLKAQNETKLSLSLLNRRLFMTDAKRRSVEDFYAHRALVLKRIQQALKEQNAKNRK